MNRSVSDLPTFKFLRKLVLRVDPRSFARLYTADLKTAMAGWFTTNPQLASIHVTQGDTSMVIEKDSTKGVGPYDKAEYDEEEWLRYERDDYLPLGH